MQKQEKVQERKKVASFSVFLIYSCARSRTSKRRQALGRTGSRYHVDDTAPDEDTSASRGSVNGP